jgi:septal ring factor EnvC (AmiA/AmiB activator)
MVYMIMQKSAMEKVYADECCKLKSQIAELEQKLEVATRSLNVAESNLAVRNAEVDSLQNSLKELDELREFKAVRDVQ